MFVNMMTISMIDIMTNILTILTMMIRLIMMATLVCMALLGQMTELYHDLHGSGRYCVSRAM